MWEARTKTARRALPLILVAACLIPFANGLTGDFTYDDKGIVRDNVRIQSAETLGQIFETPYFGGPRGSGTAYRPVLLFSFALQWWIHGRQAVLFHAVNLLLHVAATFLVWGLWRRLLTGAPAAFAAALLFAAHPIHVEAVTSLVGRGETMAAVLCLGYLHLALRLREGARWRPLVVAIALLLYSLALLTKESAAIAPALAFLCSFWFAEGQAVERAKEALRRGLPLYVGSALTLAGSFALREWVLGGWIRAGRTGIFEVENPLAALPAAARVGNACLILLRYVGRLVSPVRLTADESAWSLRPVPAASLLAIGAVLLWAAACAVALVRPRRPAALGLLFFAVAMLPASNVPFAIGTIFAERVTYLPSAGICLIAGAFLAGPAERWRAVAPARVAALAAITAILMVRTVVRDTVWASDEALFENSAWVAPESAKNQYNLGYILAEHRRFREALGAYREATRIYPKYWDAWSGEGRCERELGMLEAARHSYEKALEAFPAYENGFFGLGLVLEDRGRDREARDTYRRGLAKNPRSLALAFRLATLESRLGEPSAGDSWKRALADHPASLPTRFGYARWLRLRGDREASREELRRILAAAPRDPAALRLLAEQEEGAGRLFSAALLRERAFRATRRTGDLLLVIDAARRDPAYRRRFEALRPRLERLAPWAFSIPESSSNFSASPSHP